MTSPFTAKKITVPGLLDNAALQEQLKQFGDQMKTRQNAAPPPTAAFNMADRVATEYLDRPARQIRREQPSSRLRDTTALIGSAITFSPAMAFSRALERAGTLTPEESQQEAEARAETFREREQNFQTKAEVREQLRGMPTSEARQLGLPIPPGVEERDEAFDREMGERDQAVVERATEQREQAEAAVRGEAPQPTQTWWLNAAQTGARTAAQMGVSGIKYPFAIWEQYEAAVTGSSEKSWAREHLDTLDKALTTMLPGDPARSKDFLTELSAGGGSFAAFMIAGYAGAAVGLPAAVTSGALGAAVTGTQMYEEAETFDATGMQKFFTLLLGSGLGLTEAIPIDRMLMRVDAANGGLVRRMLQNTAATSMEEFVQELSQAAGEDVVAKYMVGYDAERELDPRDWLRQGAIGAITGAGGGAIATAIGEAGGTPSNMVPEAQREQIANEVIEELQLQFENAFRDQPLAVDVDETADQIAEATPTVDLPTQLPTITVTPGEPARVEEFLEQPAAELFQRPGWSVLTAVREDVGDFTAPENAEALANMRRQLEEAGIPFVEVGGTYQGVDQGTSFLIQAPEDQALDLARQYGQESILTNRGLVYTDGRVVPAVPEQTVIGDAAREGDFFSTLPDGTAFSVGLDFDNTQTPEAPLAVDDETMAAIARQVPQPTAEDYIARANAPMQTFRGGDLPVNEEGLLEITHFSSQRLRTVDPERMGTGPLRGQERRRLFGPDAVPRAYYGVNAVESMPARERRQIPYDVQERGGYIREGGLGGERHTVLVDPNRVYNWYQDPLGLKAQLDRSLPGPDQVTQYERIIRDAGFDGIFISPSPLGQTVAMFTPEQPVAADAEIEAMVSPERQRQLAQEVPGLRGALKYLTDDEKVRLKRRTAERLVDIFDNMPDPKEMAAVAVSARAKRGWYARSAEALVDIFGIEDAPRFAALLAALSPQTSVESNATNALKVWTAWVKAGRPTDRNKILRIMGNNVQGGRGQSSILPAWINNTMRALMTPDATAIKLSGPKVNSFMKNLQGVTVEVTNDAWMANYANIDQALLGGSPVRTDGETIKDKSVGYMAMSAAVRAAAETATQITGETWTPSEIQETVWSWAKALYEAADSATDPRNAEEILRAGGLTSEQIAAVPDFATLFASGVYSNILEQGGYDVSGIGEGGGRVDGPDGPRGSVFAAEGTGFAERTFQRHLARAAQRLDELRRQRRSDEGIVSEEGQPPEEVAPVDEPVRPDDWDEFLEFEATVMPEEDLRPLPGLPSNSTGPVPSVVQAARAYARSIGLPLRRQKDYVKVDVNRARRIAQAYEDMEHNPQDPAVQAAFRAMIDETLAQFQFVKASGLDIDFIEEGQPDPYPEGPKQVLDDLTRGHLWVFPTDQGFGTMTEAERTNPLLEETDEVVKGRRLLANDVFRIVHDFFGHGMEGSGFGPRGEENAWQSHMRLYTDAALPAVTTETRGQNSWVNYGPFGEQNRADPRNTVYADQKTGLMPEWTWREGVADDDRTEEREAQYDEGAEEAMAGGTATQRAPYRAEQTRPAAGVPADQRTAQEGDDLSLSRISRNFIRVLDLTARQGRFTLKGSEVMGQYSRRSSVVRLRTWSDLSTLVHEGGHALHDAMRGPLEAFAKQHEQQLMQVGTDLYAGDLNTVPRETHVREGFAEFFRIFTLNRAYTRREYPQLADAFEQLLERDAPQMLEGLDLIGQQFHAWLQLPSARVLRGMISPAERDTGITQAINELREVGFNTWMHEHVRGIMQAAVNRNASMNEIVAQMLNRGETNQGRAIDLARADDPRVLVRLARNAGGRAMVQITDGIMAYRSVQSSTRGLRDALLISQGRQPDENLREIDETRMQDFDAYLVALRALDEARRLDEGKIDRFPIGASIGDVRQTITDLEAQYGDSFTQAAEIVNEYGMAMWQKQYDAGLISKETYQDGLDRRFYAPLQRDMSDRQAALGVSAITGGQSIVRRFRGSDRDIVSPFAVLVQKTFALEQSIAQNDIVKALARLSDRVGTSGAFVERIPATTIMGKQFSVKEVARQLTGDDSLTETDAADLMTILQASIEDDSVISLFRAEQAPTKGENVLFFWEKGKLAAIQLADGSVGADVVNLLNGLGRENMNFGMELIAMTSTAFRASITSWPDFLMVNFVRDQMSAWVLTDVGFKPFATGLRGVGDELRQNQWAKMYNASMGIMGGMNVAALHEARVNRSIDSLRNKGYLARVFGERGFGGAVRGLARVTELTETGTRLGLFRSAYQRAQREGLSEWEAAIEAAYTATDYIDFGLNGSRMLHARRLIPFLNAQIQGLYKMVRALGADEVRQRRGLKFALRAFFKNVHGMDLSRTERQALITGRKAWVKMSILGLFSAALHFLFEDDPDYQEAGEYLRTTGWVFPMGDGRLFYVPKPFELALVANAVERGLEHASGDAEAKNRFMRGLALSFAPPTSPPAVQALVEYAANKDFFTGREIVPDYMQALEPQLQFNNYTTALAREIGDITGWSPMVVDHFMSSLGASAYRDLTTMTNALDPSRPTMDATDAPILRRFIRDTRRGSTSAQDFWAQASTINGRMRRAELTYRRLLDGGNEPAANAYLEGLEEDEMAYALLNAHFKADAKRLNPIYRGRQITTVVSAMRRELVSELGLENTAQWADAPIRMSATEKARVDEVLSEYARREIRNTLIATGAPGWAHKQRLPVEPTAEMLREIDPRVREELDRRLEKARVYHGETVFENWPEVRNRLISDRAEAFLGDMVTIAKVAR